jgi:VIT1/CCC1 family predicted Fe2+/Mn2+ transporter
LDRARSGTEDQRGGVRDDAGRAKPETLPHPEDRQLPTIPHSGPVKEQEKIHGKSGALRAAIFGLNDGLVSNFALIFGVAGSGVSGNVVVIAGIAGLVAGAFSMGAGEYVSMRVQREVSRRRSTRRRTSSRRTPKRSSAS